MKKISLFIILFLALVSTGISAQNKLIQEGRTWEYICSLGGEIWYEQYCFDGICNVEGKTYNQWKLLNKIYESSDSKEDRVETFVDQTVALLREEEGKVYIFLAGDSIRTYDSSTQILSAPYTAPKGDEEILYDFTLTPQSSFMGTVQILWAEELRDLDQTVISNSILTEIGRLPLIEGEAKQFNIRPDVFTALVRNIPKIDLGNINEEINLKGGEETSSNIDDQTLLSYAEIVGNIGRGNMTSLMPSYPIFLSSGVLDYQTSKLSCVFDSDGTLIYGIPSGIVLPEIYPSDESHAIYDLHGRQISNPLPGTVYIRNGKKYVK